MYKWESTVSVKRTSGCVKCSYSGRRGPENKYTKGEIMKNAIIASVVLILLVVLTIPVGGSTEAHNTESLVAFVVNDQSATEFIAEENANAEYGNETNEEEFERPYIPGIPLDDELLDYIWKRSLEVNLAYELILAIIAVESNFNTEARSATSDSGLAQINNANVEWLSELAGIEDVDPMNPYHSIDMMIALLNYEREYYYSLELPEEDVYWCLIITYNMGRGNALKYMRQNGYEYGYAKKVDEMKRKFEREAIYEEDAV